MGRLSVKVDSSWAVVVRSTEARAVRCSVSWSGSAVGLSCWSRYGTPLRRVVFRCAGGGSCVACPVATPWPSTWSQTGVPASSTTFPSDRRAGLAMGGRTPRADRIVAHGQLGASGRDILSACSARVWGCCWSLGHLRPGIVSFSPRPLGAKETIRWTRQAHATNPSRTRTSEKS
jgi:hypothetical protein